jgi:CubicO group peptidase (beta-lactamase class C family)
MRLRRLTATAVVLVAGACGSSGDSEPSPSPTGSDRAARSDLVLSVRLTPDKPGCSAAVGVDGQVVWTGFRGVADLAGATPISADTVFDIASVSKQFTATAVLLLAQEGALSIQDTLATRLPGMPAWSRQVTIAQLIHHDSGIPEYFKVMEARGHAFEERATQADAVRSIASIPRLGFRPGAKFEYSNSNYVLLAEVVHRVSGSPLPEFLRQRVFGPLGLGMVMAPVEKVAGKATSYDGLELRVATSPWEMIGDGSVQSTPSDLVRWADNYRTGKVGGPALLTAQLADPVDSDVPGESAYAAGVVVAKDGALSHEGGWLGFRTSFQITADRHVAVAVACNAANHDPAPMAEQLRRIWA